MFKEDDPKEIDEALRIARETRQSILDGKKKVQNNLRGFLTVAQILSRNEDLLWAKNELTGYENFSDLPEYRLNCYGRISWTENRIPKSVDSHEIPISMAVPKIEALISEKENYMPIGIRPIMKKNY